VARRALRRNRPNLQKVVSQRGSKTELKSAALTYMRELRIQLLPRLDVLQYIEDSKVRRDLQAELGLRPN